MRLPNKEQASRSMARTMRRAITEDNRIAHRASFQKFTPMPTNYNEVGRAQAAAALATTRVWDSANRLMGQMAEIDFEQQKSALAAKKARLMEFTTAYNTDAATQDLTQTVEGTLTKKHKMVKSDFQSQLSAKLEELDEEYAITDPRLKEEWNNIRIGIVSETSNYLTKLVDKAKDQEAKDNAETAYLAIKTKDDFIKWDEEFGPNWYTPMQREQMRRNKYNDIEIKGLNRALDLDPKFNSNIEIIEYQKGEQERLANGELYPEAYAAITQALNARRQQNIDNAARELSVKLQSDPLYQQNAYVRGQLKQLDKEYGEGNMGPEMYAQKRRLLEGQLQATLNDSTIEYYRETVGIRANREVSAERARNKELLDSNEISAEEYDSRESQLDKVEARNRADATEDLAGTEASLIHIMTEYHISQDNVADPNAARRRATLEESRFHETETRKALLGIKELYSSGNKEDALLQLGELAESIPEAVMTQEDYATTMAQISGVQTDLLSAELEQILKAENYTTTKLIEENGQIVEDETTQNSKAATWLKDLRDDMMQNPKKYGITGELGKVQAVREKLAEMGLVIDSFASIEMRAKAERNQITEKTRKTLQWGADPSLMSGFDFSNFSEADEAAWAQDAFENYVENRRKETLQEQMAYAAAENKPYPGQRPDIHTYAREFTLASGYAPPGYVQQLSEILNNPARAGLPNAKSAAMNLLDLLLMNPGIRNQDKLEQSGFDTALAVGMYIQKSGSAEGAAEYLANLRQIQMDPAHKDDIDRIKRGTQAGGSLDQEYMKIRSVNTWMPAEMDPRMRDHVASIIGPIFNKLRSEPAAMHKALQMAMQQWAPEPIYTVNEDGERVAEFKWKYMSIYANHNSASRTSPAHRDAQRGGAGWFDGGVKENLPGSDSNNNFVHQTVVDIALEHNQDPDKVSTEWVGPESIDPRYRNDPQFKNGGWVLTNQGGAFIPDQKVFLETGVEVPIFIGRDTLSPRASKNKRQYERDLRYKGAKKAYEDWQDYMSISTDNSKNWAVRIKDGTLRWFETDDKQVNQAIRNTPELEAEKPDKRTWQDKLANAETELDQFVAKKMLELFESHPYRAAHIDTTTTPEEKKELLRLMQQHAQGIASDWFHAQVERKLYWTDYHQGKGTTGGPR